jgi:hypothetical protein
MEKILISVPNALQNVSLVVVDGSFTGFDPFGASRLAQFGSAKYANHWDTSDADLAIPESLVPLINDGQFHAYEFSHFARMRSDAVRSVPLMRDARYMGSRFTLKVTEHAAKDDRRLVYVESGDSNELHVFSGKAVAAVRAARMVCLEVARRRES